MENGKIPDIKIQKRRRSVLIYNDYKEYVIIVNTILSTRIIYQSVEQSMLRLARETHNTSYNMGT